MRWPPILRKTDLNEGSGEPWAGHNKLRELADSLVNVKVSVLSENLGLAPPIGSEMIF